MVKEKKLLIIGKVPPPIGGVAIHVKRLMEWLNYNNVEYTFISLGESKINIFNQIIKSKVIHLHSSNPYLRFVIALACRLFRITLIQTYHGNIGRFKYTKNLFDIASIRLTKVPILINKLSYEIAIKKNRRSLLIPAFIMPLNEENLSNEIKQKILNFKKKYKTIYCTNAFNYSKDKNNNEIYGGIDICKIIIKNSGIGLIFSDPSSHYKIAFLNHFGHDYDNILFISEPHSFIEVIKLSDCFIRATTTDGDSLSVKEALAYGKNVIASNCVDRPEKVILYNTLNFEDMESKILSVQDSKSNENNIAFENPISELIKLYNLLK